MSAWFPSNAWILDDSKWINAKRKTKDEDADCFLVFSIISRNEARHGIMCLGAIVLLRCH